MKPARQLAQHLLELPYHSQVKIAYTMGFGTKYHDISDLDTTSRCHEICIQAYKDKNLELLWREVETAHRNGQPEPNPFKDYNYVDKKAS